MKKFVSIITILSFCAVALLLILALFGAVALFEGMMLNVLITLVTVAIGGFFAINSLNFMAKNKGLSWVSLILILASVGGILLAMWANIASDIFGKFIFTFALLSVFFNVLVNYIMGIGKRAVFIQVVVYLIVFATVMMGILFIWGLPVLPITVIVTLIILSIVGVVILRILSKKSGGEAVIPADKMLISKAEYEDLKQKEAMLNVMLSKIKE